MMDVMLLRESETDTVHGKITGLIELDDCETSTSLLCCSTVGFASTLADIQ